MDGYTLNLNGSLCLKCNDYCKSCDKNNLSMCLSCFDGFYLDKKSSTCLECDSDCINCHGKSSDRCINCKVGYFFNKGVEKQLPKKCTPCTLNCLHCSNAKICH